MKLKKLPLQKVQLPPKLANLSCHMGRPIGRPKIGQKLMTSPELEIDPMTSELGFRRKKERKKTGKRKEGNFTKRKEGRGKGRRARMKKMK